MQKEIDIKKKILILVGSKLGHNEERLLFNLTRMLCNDFCFHVFGACMKYKTLNALCVQHLSPVTKETSIFGSIKYFREFIKVCRIEKPHVLFQLNAPTFRGVIVFLAGLFTSTPYILRLPGDKFNIYKQKKGLRVIKEFVQNNIIGLNIFKRSPYLVVLGRYLKEELIRNGISEKSIYNIYQPIDIDKFFPVTDSHSIRVEAGLPTNKKIILYTGRLTFEKGSDLLAEIIKKVLSKRDDICFLLIGKGPYKKHLENISTDVKIFESIEFSKIDMYYKAADLFLFPSRREGVPNVALEAIACDIPIISSQAGELPYIVKHCFANIDEYVDFILNDDWTQAKCPGLPRTFLWDNLSKEYVRVLNDATG